MPFRIISTLLLFCFFGNKYAIFADSFTEAIQQREQFEKQKEVFEKLEKRQDETIIRYDVKKPELLPLKDEPCFEIKAIKDEGITLLRESEKEFFYRQYIGKCTTID